MHATIPFTHCYRALSDHEFPQYELNYYDLCLVYSQRTPTHVLAQGNSIPRVNSPSIGQPSMPNRESAACSKAIIIHYGPMIHFVTMYSPTIHLIRLVTVYSPTTHLIRLVTEHSPTIHLVTVHSPTIHLIHLVSMYSPTILRVTKSSPTIHLINLYVCSNPSRNSVQSNTTIPILKMNIPAIHLVTRYSPTVL